MPSLKMPTVGEGSTGLASLYHRISGVGVPSAWQFNIIESPEKKSYKTEKQKLAPFIIEMYKSLGTSRSFKTLVL